MNAIDAAPESMGVYGISRAAMDFAEALVVGKPMDEASKMARMTIPEGRKLMMDHRFRQALERLDHNRQLGRRFDRETAHDMLEEAFGKAETSDEIVKVVGALSKLHGLERERSPARIIDSSTGESVVDYESLSDEQLRRIIAKEQRQTGGRLPPPHPKA